LIHRSDASTGTTSETSASADHIRAQPNSAAVDRARAGTPDRVHCQLACRIVLDTAAVIESAFQFLGVTSYI
jgi:hypothetical protein